MNNHSITLNDLYLEEKLTTYPKEPLYRRYFSDQRKNYPKKLLTVSVMSYIGGYFFGLIMLAFSMLGSVRFEQSLASMASESYYKDMAEFKKAMKSKVVAPLHRNGYMVVRISLAIGLFNAVMIYFPFTSNRFGEMYGLASPDTVVYFMTPYFLFVKARAVPLPKRVLFFSVIATSAYVIKNSTCSYTKPVNTSEYKDNSNTPENTSIEELKELPAIKH